jgi:hypothetical protein
MGVITITGYSDDLVEISGDITDEFPTYDDKNYLAVSDGSVLSVVYDNDGIWRIHRIIIGSADFRKVDGNVLDDTFDIVYLEGDDIKWVVLGKEFARKRKS